MVDIRVELGTDYTINANHSIFSCEYYKSPYDENFRRFTSKFLPYSFSVSNYKRLTHFDCFVKLENFF